MADNLTPSQQEYLAGLREGAIDGSQLSIGNPTSSDFDTLRAFLLANGQPSVQSDDLLFSITTHDMLRILHYADERNCLVLQSCFGFDTSPIKDPPTPNGRLTKVGKLMLLQKGNFHQIHGRSDEELFFGDSVFRNAGNLEFFKNFQLDENVPTPLAHQFVDNFINIYPAERTLTEDPFIHGFLLPVKALIKLFTDPNSQFGTFNELSIGFGLTAFNIDGSIGNFTLTIGSGDLRVGQVIEFRTVDIVGTGAGDCPPKTGCR